MAPAPLAITGIGLLTAAGEGLEPLARAIAEGRSCIGPLPEEVSRGLAHKVGGRFPVELVPASGPDRALIAADRAVRAAMADVRRDALLVSLGTGLGPSEGLEQEWELARASPAALTEALCHGLGKSPLGVQTFAVTCLSSLCSLEAGKSVGRGVAIGIETLSRTIQAGFSCLEALSKTDGREPDGIVLGEAACALVLEPLALAGSGRTWARLVAQAMRVDGNHLTSPDPAAKGLSRAIAAALHQAQVNARDVDRLLLTAPASPGYAAQYERALGELWGPAWRDRASTWEGVTGHCLGASTAVGVAWAAHLFATAQARRALVLSVGFGGQSGATLLEGP